MNVEVFCKIAMVVVGIAGNVKFLYDLWTGKRGRLREEYKFAKEFLTDVMDKSMHPYLREKGYKTLAGDERLTGDEVEYLLTLKNSEQALKDYVLGRPYLRLLSKVGNLQIEFQEAYRNSWMRWVLKGLYLIAYCVLWLLASAPIILSKSVSRHPTIVLATTAVTLTFFGPYAVLALKASVRIHRAEKLLSNQKAHTQLLVVESVARSRRVLSPQGSTTKIEVSSNDRQAEVLN
jgi:hypothetical protein